MRKAKDSNTITYYIIYDNKNRLTKSDVDGLNEPHVLSKQDLPVTF